MRWGDMRESQNVEDRTGMPGGGGGFPFGGGARIGLGSLVVLLIVGWLFGINPLEMLGVVGGPGPVSAPEQRRAPEPGYGPQNPTSPSQSAPRPKSQETEFSSRVLGDTEDVWSAVFQASGSRYEPPRLVLYRGRDRSACGMANAAVGPFYCPGDRSLYLDTTFFQQLRNQFGAPGDFAQAYVIAHEVGHHVQNLLGTMRQFDAESRRADTRTRNELSVRLELQADCYAGVWGFFAQKRNLLEPGDLEEGLRAAAAVGDDQLQKRSQGYAVPESFTHGSAQQRMRWFKTGLDSGDPRRCNTFEARVQ